MRLIYLLHLFLGCQAVAKFSTLKPSLENSTVTLIDFIKSEGDRNESGLAWNWLAALVDRFGHRQVGSTALTDSLNYLLAKLTQEGFPARLEPVYGLPYWVRGDDDVSMIEPRKQRLTSLTVAGVDPAEIFGEVVVVHDFEELDQRNVSGKIVLMIPEWKGYGKTAGYRSAADKVQAAGGIGFLVKSIAPFSIGSPHTGQGYKPASIPAVCLTIEEAEMIERIVRRGERVVVSMSIKSANVGSTKSDNLVFDIIGSERPKEIVLISAHIDSWDVGQGALDDGGGMAAVWQAMYTLKRLADHDPAYRPRRTIRAVFWTAEEQGFLGAKAYYEQHKRGGEEFVFVSETDQGAFRPRTLQSQLRFQGPPRAQRRIENIARVLTENGVPLSVMPSNSQGDVQFWADDGVASINYVSELGNDYYFYFHHTRGDYMTVFKHDDLQYTSAIFAALAHVIANIRQW